MSLTVWTEREQGAWTDCTYSAVLMALVYGGHTEFPLGLYSVAERNALESSDDRPDGQGATFDDTDLAVKRRYGIAMARINDGSREGVRALLSTPGVALAIAGSNARPMPEHLRRWQPSFRGAHAVCVIPLGNGMVRWLDPLATPGFTGDGVSIDDVLTWAFIPSDARVVRQGEYGPPKETAQQREERLAREVLTLRRDKPRAAARWIANTGMTQKVDGMSLRRVMRLAAEVTYLRESTLDGD